VKLAALLLIFFSLTLALSALPPIPEIDPNSTISALTLLGGALLLVRAARKK
jgi:hypothetical protein